MPRITDRDNEMLKHMKFFGFLNLRQAQKIFFPEADCSYQIASRRLLALKHAGFVEVGRDEYSNQNIYIPKGEKAKFPSQHRIKVLDVYAQLKHDNCCKVKKFEIEKFWDNGNVRSDGFVIFSINNILYRFFIEVQLSNNEHNLKKYDKLFKTGEVQTYINDSKFPRVLLISDTDYGNIHLQHTEVIQLKTNLQDIAKIYI